MVSHFGLKWHFPDHNFFATYLFFFPCEKRLSGKLMRTIIVNIVFNVHWWFVFPFPILVQVICMFSLRSILCLSLLWIPREYSVFPRFPHLLPYSYAQSMEIPGGDGNLGRGEPKAFLSFLLRECLCLFCGSSSYLDIPLCGQFPPATFPFPTG